MEISTKPRVTQCQKPSGWLGRLVLRNMNSRHAKLTDWGLARVTVGPHDTVLDVGCGGGRTVSKLATFAAQGKVYGIDFSSDSVAIAAKINRQAIADGRIEIRPADVSQLPFPEGMFDLATAVETHFWWPDLPRGMSEIVRVLKPGGRLLVIAEVYKGAENRTSRLAEKYAFKTGMKMLSPDEHRRLFEDAGLSNVDIGTDSRKGWICVAGVKPGGQG